MITIYKGVEIHQNQPAEDFKPYFYANIKRGVLISETMRGIKNLITRYDTN